MHQVLGLLSVWLWWLGSRLGLLTAEADRPGVRGPDDGWQLGWNGSAAAPTSILLYFVRKGDFVNIASVRQWMQRNSWPWLAMLRAEGLPTGGAWRDRVHTCIAHNRRYRPGTGLTTLLADDGNRLAR
jgi:hypothetical protein